MLLENRSTPVGRLFHRLHSYPKLIICIALALLVFLLCAGVKGNFLTHLMIGWDMFSFSMILIDWTTFASTS
ncbi:MAG: hypothetical protein KGM98_15370, partial [Bacteroidota bacterium]|nr:hypothetical protein [Bacteroidota bacterium]